MAGNFWTVDNDDKYGYKSLLMHICSPDRFPEPDRAGIAIELQGHLKNIDWNDIYNLSKIRKQAKGKLGVDVDVAQLYSHLMEVFSPEKYKKVGAGAERLEQYDEICKTLTAAKDDINLLESDLYDIAKIDMAMEKEEMVDTDNLENGSEEGTNTEREPEESSEKILDEPNLSESVEEIADEEDNGSVGGNEDVSLKGDAEEVADNNKLEDKDFEQQTQDSPEQKPEIGASDIGGNSDTSGASAGTVPETLPSVQPPHKKRRIFSHPFSFRGRITKGEYWLTILICFILFPVVIPQFTIVIGHFTLYLLSFYSVLYMTGVIFLGFLFCWFLVAQGTKRCHDMDCSGWCQITIIWVLVLLFGDGDSGENEYGDCPK